MDQVTESLVLGVQSAIDSYVANEKHLASWN